VRHVQVREQCVVLKHHANTALLWRRAVVVALPTTCFDRRISPAATGSSPATARSKVVLPQPEGPISTPMSPARSPNDTSSTAALAASGVLHTQLETSRNMLMIVDAYNSHLHHMANLSTPDTPSCQHAGFPTFLLMLVALVLTCCRCWPCLRRGCNGTNASAQILGEMARTVLPDYAWTTLRLCVMVALGVAAGGLARRRP
jgi:hypothetical protein